MCSELSRCLQTYFSQGQDLEAMLSNDVRAKISSASRQATEYILQLLSIFDHASQRGGIGSCPQKLGRTKNVLLYPVDKR